MAEYQPTFDQDKLRELIVHIAWQSQDDSTFGAVKLNKILYYADFYAYRKLGASITGAEYQKLPEGPAPRRLLPARASLIEDGSIRIEFVPRFNYVQQRIVPLRKPDLSRFSAEELRIVDEVIEALRGKSAREVSHMSHEELGWQVVEDYQTIPYRTAWLSAEPLSEEELSLARQVAAEHELESVR
jgi:hypothetical protein